MNNAITARNLSGEINVSSYVYVSTITMPVEHEYAVVISNVSLRIDDDGCGKDAVVDGAAFCCMSDDHGSLASQ
jgi:hypothetical protein